MNRTKLSVGNCAVLELAAARAREERSREISRDHLLAAICIFASGETPEVRWISGERLEEERQALLGFFREGDVDPIELLRAVAPVPAWASLQEFGDPIGRSPEAREVYARAREIASPDEPLCTHLLAALLHFPDSDVAVNSTGNQPTAEGRSVAEGSIANTLSVSVVGQEEAVATVGAFLRVARSGLRPPQRPQGVLMFTGPTGVGKTEMARAVAKALYGDANRLARFDMSEYTDVASASRIVGASPGYVGYGEPGGMVNDVRERPDSVFLLDEAEKAHPIVWDLLLPLLDEGRLTDGQGQTVDGRQGTYILTSNLVAAPRNSRTIGFNAVEAPVASESAVRRALLAYFRPELLNRIDEVVLFRPLARPAIVEIARKMLGEVAQRAAVQGIEVRFNDEVVEWVAEEGCDPEFGARALWRTIERLVCRPLSEVLLRTTASRLCGTLCGGRLQFAHP